MAYPGSNITFNLYDVNPPSYPVGLERSSMTGSSASDKDVLRPKSPISAANAMLPPPSRPSRSPSRAAAPLPVSGADADPTNATTGSGSNSAGSGGANLKKSQSLRVPTARTPAPLAIPTARTGTDNSTRPSTAHPGSLSRSSSLLATSAASSSGSQSAGGLLGSSNPFNDFSSSLQIPSFRPNLSRMGRKISEFGKEVFSLEEEDVPTPRSRTPGIGVGGGAGGGAAAAALGGKAQLQQSAGGDALRVQAPPLMRSGTAPVPSVNSVNNNASTAAQRSTDASAFVAPRAGMTNMTNAPVLSASSALPSPAIRTLSSSAMTSSVSQPLPGVSHSHSQSHSQRSSIARPTTIPEDVPGMGDEPIMCPFCDKPLPPPLIISQLAHLHAAKERGKRSSEATLVDRAMADDKSARARGSTDSAITPAPAAAAAATAPRAVESDRSKKGLEEQVEKASAESFLPVVKQSEEAERAASAPGGVITEKDIAEWSRRAGLPGPPSAVGNTTDKVTATGVAESTTSTATKGMTSSTTITSAPIAAPTPKAFPLLPPPPPPASRVKSPVPPTETTSAAETPKADGRRASRFGGLFGKKASGNEEDDSDDDYAQGGYAKLSGPASPERVENRRLELEERRKSPVGEKGREDGGEIEEGKEKGDGSDGAAAAIGESAVDEDAKTSSSTVKGADTLAGEALITQGVESTPAEQDELKKVLQEVLAKVDMMTKSHTDLAASHNNLLTSLKIARSNLVMAEANAEMLEEQLRKASEPPTGRSSVVASARTSTDAGPGRRSIEESRRPANPIAAAQNAEGGVAKPRPNSLIIPASALFETGPMTGPASSQAGSKAGKDQNAGGVFGGFFGGKSLHIPTAKELQASAVRLGDSLAGPSRPGTPINGGLMLAGPGGASGIGYAHAQGSQLLRGETPTISKTHAGGTSSGAERSAAMRETGSSPAQFFDYHMPSPPTSHLPSPNPDGPINKRSPSPNPGSGQSASPSGQLTPLARPALSPAHSGQFATEFAKLRTAYANSQNKMEAMAKELTDLKKGKIEMEAELETLSQALFEEANKMVADERRKRLESEELLKEVKEEKEVLKETIKVLGGKDKVEVPDVKVSGDDEPAAKDAVAKTGDKGKDVKKPEQHDIDDPDWKPRDLDKHYEALRKTIHHVADGASPGTAVLGSDSATFSNAVNYTGATRDFEAALDEVQAAAEAEGVLGFTPVAVNPVLELSPVLPKHDAVSGAELNPWAEVDFSGGTTSSNNGKGTSHATSRKGSQHGYGVDPLEGRRVSLGLNPEGRRESLGLNLVGVNFGEGLDGSMVLEPPVRPARDARPAPREEVVVEDDVPGAAVRMRRTSSA